jgi:hypothetical protein
MGRSECYRHKRNGWRREAAEKICKLLSCGTNAVESVGIDPIEAVVDVLMDHRCIHDPIPEENILCCVYDEDL